MEIAGKLHFALRYDKEIEGLVVKVRTLNEIRKISFVRPVFVIPSALYIKINYTFLVQNQFNRISSKLIKFKIS